MTIYAYIRVSTDKQNNENQRFQIKNYCKEKNLPVDEWVEEVVSSRKDLKKRKFYQLLKKLKSGDMILACEISRLGRSLFEIMEILAHCMSVGCRVQTIKDKFILGNNIQSKVLAFAFALAAEVERQLISERTIQSLARRKAEGKPIGRMKGALNKTHKLDGKQMQIMALIEQGVPRARIAKLFHCHRDTLRLFLQRHQTLSRC